jgi:hypothetical protein
MNSAIDDFVSKFEERYSKNLIDPASFKNYSKKPSFSKYFKFFYDKKPDSKLSDWDLACWLDTDSITVDDLQQIDGFIRAFKGFSHVGLFTTADHDQVKHLHYMAYTPDQPWAPFLDLHLRGDVGEEKFSAIYPGNEEGHKLWTILTTWRKINKGESGRGIQTFREQNHGYWPEEDVGIIKDDPERYYRDKFPNLDAPRILL